MTALYVIRATKHGDTLPAARLDLPSRPVPPDTHLPSLMRRLKCGRHRSKRVNIKPQPYSGEGGQLPIKLFKNIKKTHSILCRRGISIGGFCTRHEYATGSHKPSESSKNRNFKIEPAPRSSGGISFAFNAATRRGRTGSIEFSQPIARITGAAPKARRTS